MLEEQLREDPRLDPAARRARLAAHASSSAATLQDVSAAARSVRSLAELARTRPGRRSCAGAPSKEEDRDAADPRARSAAAAAAALAGCSLLAPARGSLALLRAGAARRGGGGGRLRPRLGVGPVRIAGYLRRLGDPGARERDRSCAARRSIAGREPLDEASCRVLAREPLRASSARGTCVLFPWYAERQPDAAGASSRCERFELRARRQRRPRGALRGDATWRAAAAT